MPSTMIRAVARLFLIPFLIAAAPDGVVFGQNPTSESGIVPATLGGSRVPTLPKQPSGAGAPKGSAISTLSLYYDPLQGASSSDLVRRALSSNAEISAVRLDIERARARLRQTGLFPNPTVDFEQTTGRWTGSPGERETSIGFALSIDVAGVRRRRVDLARAELEAAAAEVADRERRLIAEVRTAYAEAMAALRELEITENLNNLDIQTARVVEVRVTEGESSPLELNLLRTEVERIRARRSLVEGRLQAGLIRLRTVSGIAPNEPLRLGEDLSRPTLAEPPSTKEEAIDIALRTRPDLKLAQLNEEAAKAGLRLARAQGNPDLTAFSKYTKNSAVFDNTAVGVLRDKDRLLTFGVSIGIPLFNRNQGAKAEAAAAILQAQKRREFVETVVRSEVASAYARYEAASATMAILEQGVLARSQQNIKSVRGAYEIGAFRVTDLLVEQRRFVDSQREFIEAMTERYRALADLQAALGIPINPPQDQNKK